MLICRELVSKPIEIGPHSAFRRLSTPLRARSYVGLLLCCIVLAKPEFLPAQEYPTPPPVQEFSEQVLQPIATQIANDQITQLKYELAFQHAKNERLSLEKGNEDLDVQSYKMFDYPITGAGVIRNVPGKDTQDIERRIREAQHNEFLAWLDTRRIPLKDDLVAIWGKNVLIKGRSYYVCIDSIWREYTFHSGRFYRLDNAVGGVAHKTGICERLDLKTMKSLKWREDSIR